MRYLHEKVKYASSGRIISMISFKLDNYIHKHKYSTIFFIIISTEF